LYETDVLKLYFHVAHDGCGSPAEYPAGSTIDLVYKTELWRSAPVPGPADTEITGFIEDREPADCGDSPFDCVRGSRLFGFGEISSEQCTIYQLVCTCVSPDGFSDWSCERTRNYLPWTTDIVSCDPLLIDFYSGSTKMATITRA
jgi:hypothetical protein